MNEDLGLLLPERRCALWVLLAGLALAGCGRKGDLYLPDDPQSEETDTIDRDEERPVEDSLDTED